MRACLNGFSDLSIILCRQNPRAMQVRNHYGETCLGEVKPPIENVEWWSRIQRLNFRFGCPVNCSKFSCFIGSLWGWSKWLTWCQSKGSDPRKKWRIHKADTYNPEVRTASSGSFQKNASCFLLFYSSSKFRAKSVDNTDHLMAPTSSNCGLRFKMKYLSTSPSRMSLNSGSMDSSPNSVCSSHGAKRRLNKRPSLDSGIHLARAETSQFINPNYCTNDSEMRKILR